jgi:hypothetical protein
MGGRVVVLNGWQAWALGAVVVAVLLVALFFVGFLVLGLAIVGALALIVHRALRAVGLAKPPVRQPHDPGVIEGEYQVVERRLTDAER